MLINEEKIKNSLSFFGDINDEDKKGLQSNFETFADLIWKIDVKNNLFYMKKNNDKIDYKITGVGKGLENWREFFHPSDKPRLYEHFSKLILENKDVFENVYRVLAADNLYYWIFCTDFVKRDIEGNPIEIESYSYDVTAKFSAKEYLLRLAYFDELTGLPNKLRVIEEFNGLTEIDKEKNIAFVYLDIDNFDYINNSYGYFFGDELLKELSNKMKGFHGIYSGRVTKDKFILIVNDFENKEFLKKTILRLKNQMEHSDFVKNLEIQLNLNIGVSLYKKDGLDPQKLIDFAEIANKEAKRIKNHEIEFYSTQTLDKVKTRLTLIKEIKQAIEKNEFQMYFQPIVQNDLCHGVEALIRWNHPKKGLVFPNYFISVVEDSDLMIDLEMWILENIFSEISRGFKTDIFISINLSPKGLLEKDIVEIIATLVDKYSIDSSLIQLEITETALISNIEETLHKLNKLKEMGFSIALDDFGTGFSSLNYLLRLPIDRLKISKSFIDLISENEKEEKLLKHLIGLSKDLGFQIIAEGVETSEQLSILNKLQCNYIQGYYYAKPMSINNFNQWIKISLKNTDF